MNLLDKHFVSLFSKEEQKKRKEFYFLYLNFKMNLKFISLLIM